MVLLRGKRKALREDKGSDYAKKQKVKDDDCGIEKLPDGLVIDILSRLSLKDAMKTSVLSCRWENLWKFTTGKLEFIHSKDCGRRWNTRLLRRRVDRVLYSHQGTQIDSLTIRFPYGEKLIDGRCGSVDEWVDFAMLKETKRFELDLSIGGPGKTFAFHCDYTFPDLIQLLAAFPCNKWLTLFLKSGSYSRCLRSLGAFCSLRSIRLVDVHIRDEVVCYFLASCRYLEQLCIKGSDETINLQVVDPLPNLKDLEISDCCNIQSLVISVATLVSCTYGGRGMSSPIFNNYPNLSKLTLSGEFSESFIYEPNLHSIYSAQLVELVLNLDPVERERGMASPDLPQLVALKRLELNIASLVNRSLVFFTSSLIKASPQLQVLKIKIAYLVPCPPLSESYLTDTIPFPEVSAAEADVSHHENLKEVSMAGYWGCASEDEFLAQLCEIALSLETVFIDTDCDYYADHPDFCSVAIYKLRRDGHEPLPRWRTAKPGNMPRQIMTPSRARNHALKFKSTFPSKIKFLIT